MTPVIGNQSAADSDAEVGGRSSEGPDTPATRRREQATDLHSRDCGLSKELELGPKFNFFRSPAGILGERFYWTCTAEPSDYIFSSQGRAHMPHCCPAALLH